MPSLSSATPGHTISRKRSGPRAAEAARGTGGGAHRRFAAVAGVCCFHWPTAGGLTVKHVFWSLLRECSSHFLGLGLFCKRPELQRDKSRNQSTTTNFRIQELDHHINRRATELVSPGQAAAHVSRAPACGRGRSGMSAGAADDDELLSVADIIDEALAIIAATDEAPSPDDECTGTGAGNGAARRGPGAAGGRKSWEQWERFGKRVAQGKAYVSCAIDFGQPWSGACAPRSWSACTASTTPPRRTTR